MFSALALLVILTSFATFTAFNKFLEFGYVPIPKGYSTGDKQMKWRNTLASLAHAIVTSILSSLSLPALWPDFVENYTTFGEVAMATVTGYEIYDCIAMLQYQKFTRIWAILLHHALGGGFGACMLYYRINLAYGVFCTTVEINSIFLHFRLILQMYGVAKDSPLFRLNNILYIPTFILHRVPVFLMMLYFLFGDRGQMPAIWNNSLIIATSGMLYINVYFFRKVLRTDMKKGVSGGW